MNCKFVSRRFRVFFYILYCAPTDIRILFTNYDIIAYFLNLASCSEHFISIEHRILATFNINKKKSILTLNMVEWKFVILCIIIQSK